jgi:hypothetical protein
MEFLIRHLYLFLHVLLHLHNNRQPWADCTENVLERTVAQRTHFLGEGTRVKIFRKLDLCWRYM